MSENNESRRWQRKLIWLLPPLAPILHFLPALFSGTFYSSRDSSAFVYVLRRWHWDRLASEGQFPLWNDGLFSGLAHLSDPQLGLFGPTNLLYLLTEGYLAQQLTLMLLLSAGGLGMALLLKQVTRDELVSVILGACYALSGVVLSNMVASPFLAGVCLFPWTLWASRRFQARQTLSAWLLLVICLALPVLEGDPFGVFWMSGALVVDVLFGGIRGRIAILGGVLGAGLLAVGLSAPAWLPAFDTLAMSLRAKGLDYGQASWFSLAPGQLLQCLLPSLWGQSGDGSFWGQELVASDLPYGARFWLDSVYMGIPLLVGLTLGIWQALKARRELAWLIFGLFYLGVALGDAFFLHPWMFDLLPFYGRLRFPAKFFSYAHLFLFVLAGLGMAALRARGVKGLRLGLTATAGLFGLSALLAFLVDAPEAQAAAGEALTRNVWTAGLMGLAAAGLALLVYFRPAWTQLRRGAFLALLALGLADLLCWMPAGRQVPASWLDEPSGLGSPIGKEPWHKLLRDGRLGRAGQSERATLKANWGLLEGLRYAYGYAPSLSARFMELHGKRVFDGLPAWSRTLGITHVLTPVRPASRDLLRLADEGHLELLEVYADINLALLAVKPAGRPQEICGACRLARDGHHAMTLIEQRSPTDDTVLLEAGELLWRGELIDESEAPDSRPVCQAAPRQGGAAGEAKRIRSDSRSRIFELSVRRDAWLLVRDTFHPGWRAFVDGKEIPIRRADYLHMALRVEAGQKRVEMRFEPPGPMRALVTCLVSLAALAGLVAVWMLRKKNPRPLGGGGQ